MLKARTYGRAGDGPLVTILVRTTKQNRALKCFSTLLLRFDDAADSPVRSTLAQNLPAIAAIAAVTPAAAATTATATTAAAAEAAATTTTAATAAEAATTAAATGATRSALSGLVDADGTSVEFTGIHLGHGALCCVGVAEGHEAKAARTASITVADHGDVFEFTEGFECAAEAVVVRGEVEATDE